MPVPMRNTRKWRTQVPRVEVQRRIANVDVGVHLDSVRGEVLAAGDLQLLRLKRLFIVSPLLRIKDWWCMYLQKGRLSNAILAHKQELSLRPVACLVSD